MKKCFFLLAIGIFAIGCSGGTSSDNSMVGDFKESQKGGNGNQDGNGIQLPPGTPQGKRGDALPKPPQ